MKGGNWESFECQKRVAAGIVKIHGPSTPLSSPEVRRRKRCLQSHPD
jgi:hypothetical protein